MGKFKFVEWNADYSVGVSIVDNQHKELINFLNAAVNHSSGNTIEERKYFDKMIHMVIQFFENHFETEEALLSETKYGKFDEHKEEHKKCLEVIKKTVKEIEDNRRIINLFELTAELKEFLLNHIIIYDKKAQDYFKEGEKMKK